MIFDRTFHSNGQRKEGERGAERKKGDRRRQDARRTTRYVSGRSEKDGAQQNTSLSCHKERQ